MKISIKNFGPIHSFDFDLEKDFHVIYGKNNIGKSYAISLVYLILKKLSLPAQTKLIQNQSYFKETTNFLEALQKKIHTSNNHVFKITKATEKYLKTLIDYFIFPDIQTAIKATFPDIIDLQNKRCTTEKIILVPPPSSIPSTHSFLLR